MIRRASGCQVGRHREVATDINAPLAVKQIGMPELSPGLCSPHKCLSNRGLRGASGGELGSIRYQRTRDSTSFTRLGRASESGRRLGKVLK